VRNVQHASKAAGDAATAACSSVQPAQLAAGKQTAETVWRLEPSLDKLIANIVSCKQLRRLQIMRLSHLFCCGVTLVGLESASVDRRL